jgi:uncharacterized protein YjcR
MHGGALGSGAPKGNQNALKHGRYTKESREERRLMKKELRKAIKVLELYFSG